jgi:hypothetical protein
MIGFQISGERDVIAQIDSFGPRLMRALIGRLNPLAFKHGGSLQRSGNMLTFSIAASVDPKGGPENGWSRQMGAAKAGFAPGSGRKKAMPGLAPLPVRTLESDAVVHEITRAVKEAQP